VTGSDELLKISARKTNTKKEETISTNNPLEKPCPNGGARKTHKDTDNLSRV
jgi:hypothetical protein